MKLLLTGFEPFGSQTINPSEQVARALATEPPASVEGVEIALAILPVDREGGPRALTEALDQQQPDAVICLGEAGGRGAISIERVAINLADYAVPDNGGHQAVDQPVVADGPAAYFTTLPVKKMVRAVADAGVPAELSLSAGSYLCNQVTYLLLHQLQAGGVEIPAGFIHLPLLPEQVAPTTAEGTTPVAVPTMSLAVQTLGVAAAITVLVDAS